MQVFSRYYTYTHCYTKWEHYNVWKSIFPSTACPPLSVSVSVEESLRGVSQKQISYKVDLYQQQVWQQEFEEDEVRERARVASVSLPHAGDWLVVAPLVALGLHLRPQEFVLAVKYRLGLAVFDQAGPCPACLKQSDVLGDHAMCCGTGGERIARHNHLRDAIFDTAAAAGLGPVKSRRGDSCCLAATGDQQMSYSTTGHREEMLHWMSQWSLPCGRILWNKQQQTLVMLCQPSMTRS